MANEENVEVVEPTEAIALTILAVVVVEAPTEAITRAIEVQLRQEARRTSDKPSCLRLIKTKNRLTTRRAKEPMPCTLSAPAITTAATVSVPGGAPLVASTVGDVVVEITTTTTSVVSAATTTEATIAPAIKITRIGRPRRLKKTM